MSYSVADAKVTEVIQAVAQAGEKLRMLLVEAERVGERLDRAVDGASAVVTEIDAQAAAGDQLWQRLKDRKEQVRLDLAAVKASAANIVSAVKAEIGA